MRLKSFMKSSGIAALAVGLAALALPSAASAAPGDRGRGGDQAQSENRGGGEGRGGSFRGGNAGQTQRAQAQPRNPDGDRNGSDAGRGWGSQRPAEGQRYGREGATVNRPAPAVRNNAPQVQSRLPVLQQREDVQRNRAYAEQNRDRTYTREAPRQQVQRQQGWDGRQWQGQNTDRNWDRNSTRNWDRDRTARNAPQQRWDGNRQGGNWNRDWRRDNRYNWQSYRSGNRNVYRMGRYYAPYGNYAYRRLSIGFYLDNLFFGSNYWISDPYMYRLPPAYGPYRWVRYYDDALLVNIYDGEVVDVIYDFFW